MAEKYVDTLKDLLQDNRLQYETFKQNMHAVPDSFQEATSNHLTLTQLRDVASNLEGENYKGREFSERDIKFTADTYDRLGIISTDTKSFSGETVYKAPNYHGRGASTSWDEIVEDLSTAVAEAERRHEWERRREAEETGLERYR
ncbi:MAG: hypothetical protein ABEK04_03040 [Candidatus Nanohalobium sp.]